MATTVTLKPNAIDLSGSTSGTTTLQATAVAGTTTVTLPAATDTLVGKATTDTLTNKTLTTPVISTISNTGTLTLPTSTDTLVGRATTDTLTNKTLTTPTISSLSSASATALTLQSAGTTAVTIDTSQRVGIGTTSPSNKLSVSGSGGVQTDIIDTGGANATLRTTNSTNTTWFGTDGATPAVGPVANASLLWGFGSYPILLATNNAERMRIDSSGNVGIGASSPNSYGAGYTVLQSAGSTGGLVQATGNSNAIIMEMHGNTSSGNGEVGTRTNTSVTIKTNNTERMRIDSSGNVGIGTTSPQQPLHVYSSAAAGKYIYAQQAGSYNIGFQAQNSVSSWYAYTAASTGNFEFFQGSGSGSVVVVSPVGLGYGTGAGGTVTQATSRATSVTINKPTGAITMFTAVGSPTINSFFVSNSLVAAKDNIVLNTQISGASNNYVVSAIVQVGGFYVLYQTTGGVASDTPIINFSIIKGATS